MYIWNLNSEIVAEPGEQMGESQGREWTEEKSFTAKMETKKFRL